MRWPLARSLRAALARMAAGMLLAATASATTPQDVLDAAPAAAWRDVSPDDVVVMQLAGGTQVAVQLAPAFAPVHVANIRAFVRAGWFDGGAIVRVQDNYVVQWAAREQPGRPLPTGVVAKPPTEYDMPDAGAAFRPLGYRDTYAAKTVCVGGLAGCARGRAPLADALLRHGGRRPRQRAGH